MFRAKSIDTDFGRYLFDENGIGFYTGVGRKKQRESYHKWSEIQYVYLEHGFDSVHRHNCLVLKFKSWPSYYLRVPYIGYKRWFDSLSRCISDAYDISSIVI